MRSDQSQGIRNPFAAAHLRKFMSIVLTVCMILTIMPVNYAAAATVTETKNVTSADVTISDASKNYIITGGTSETPAKHSVVVSPNLGTVNITLKDVNIAFDTTPVGCAFSIGAGTTVNLTLSGNSVLTSNGTFAGLHVPEGAVLNITAPDTNSTLGATGNGSGAGIGGNSGESCGKVTISNGTVNGAGVTAAGIGGGKNGGAGELTITGGRVSGLTCTDGVSDIGCGQGGSGGRVTVSGGFVHAARNLMIGGTGTVNTFTGGSICANTVTPTPTDGTQNVYRTQIELPSADNNTVITYKVGNGSTCSADAGT
ncbi:MAG TPA: hypothetical protein VHP54_07620, partial [Caproiciproducens sp.]|nr:hypothetical protein [Caproiciproducens sp.]